MSAVLRIAVQKTGRLAEDSLTLLKECGIELQTGKVALKSQAANFPLEVLFLRDNDIPAYVDDGVADIGIVGLNVLLERGKPLEIREKLGFGACRLAIAVPRDADYDSLDSLSGRRVATSHPRILAEFLKQHSVNAEIHELSGSVEIAPSIGLADAVCDLVSTGSTLISNGLVEIATVLRSEAVLIEGSSALEESKQAIQNELLVRMKAVKQARYTKYIMLNAPNESVQKIITLIPGAKSPSILPLAASGWSSIHSVVQEDDFWDVITALKAAGAEGILVLPIEKLVM